MSSPEDHKLGHWLLKQGLVTAVQLSDGLAEQRRRAQGGAEPALETVLVQMDALAPEALARARASLGAQAETVTESVAHPPAGVPSPPRDEPSPGATEGSGGRGPHTPADRAETETDTGPGTEGAPAAGPDDGAAALSCLSCGATFEAALLPERGALCCPRCGAGVDCARPPVALPAAETARGATLPGDPVAEALRALVGTSLGGVRVQALLGVGGMGAVFRGHHAGLNKTVALKVLTGEISAEMIERFRREARLAAALEHPHVVPIFNVDEDRGRHFLTMQYMDGGSLGDVLRRWGSGRALPPRLAVRLALDAARGLAGAHERGIVHRDIKPDNLLLTGAGVLKIGDFGLAKTERTESRTMTLAGGIVGSPAYMAPEQCLGEGAGPAGDLYSLGVTLYQLLAGRRPFEGDNPLVVMLKHQSERPRPLETLAPDLPAELVALVEALLQKQPGARPRGAAVLAAAFETLLDEGFAHYDRMRRDTHVGALLVRQHLVPRERLAAALRAEAAAAGPDAAPRQALAAGRRLVAQGSLSAAAFDALQRELRRARRRYERRGDGPRPDAQRRAGEEELDRLQEEAERLLAEGRHEQALTVFDAVLARHRGTPLADAVYRRLEDLQRRVALAWERRARGEARDQNLSEALDLYERALTADPRYAAGYSNRGVLLLRRGRCEEALADFARALELAPDQAAYWRNKGACLARMGRLRQAEEAYGESLARDSGNARLWTLRAGLRSERRDYDGAIADFTAALDAGADPRAVWKLRATCYKLRGEFAAAAADFSRLLALVGHDHFVHTNLGSLAVKTGDLDRAERHLKAAVRLDKERPEPFFYLACVQTARGDHDKAVALLRKAVKKGYRPHARLARDPALRPLHARPDFQALLGAM